MDTFNGLEAIPKDLPSASKLKRVTLSAVQLIVLFSLLIGLAGHERLNPRSKDTSTEFYASEIESSINLQSSTLLVFAELTPVKSMSKQIDVAAAQFYKKRNYKPAWTLNYTASAHLDSLIALLDNAEYYGFPVDYFMTDNIHSLIHQLNDSTLSHQTLMKKRTQLEIQATKSALLFMAYLNLGITANDTSKFITNTLEELPGKLMNTLDQLNFSGSFLQNQPDNPLYVKIIASLPDLIHTLIAIKNESNETISSADIARAFYFAGIQQNQQFDSLQTLEGSLKKFQRAYDIHITGEFDQETQQKLYSILRYRFYQASLNLDRLRKLTPATPDFIFVNIPEYKLRVFENGREKGIFNVMVGTKKTPTPILASKLDRIEANPFWTVPKSIAINEMLTRIIKDSTYLIRNGYYIIDNYEQKVDPSLIDWELPDPLGNKYWIRQDNISGNALGKVKFLFPNDFSVYLHDTPSKRLFTKEIRAFSHGCIRVENPEKLAQYLVANYHKDKHLDFTSKIASRERHIVELEEQIPIFIQYITCTVENDGSLIYLKDIYEKDAEEIKNLFPVSVSI